MSPDITEEVARENLSKIDHVIVLMMENRSFDHVLGYLKLDGVRPQVDGLEAGMGNADAAGTFHKVRPLGRRKIDLKALDPGHGPADVREQIAGGTMGGFLTNYVKAFERNSEDNPPPRASGSTRRSSSRTCGPKTSPSTTTWRARSGSATAGSAPSRARPGRTASTPSPASPGG